MFYGLVAFNPAESYVTYDTRYLGKLFYSDRKVCESLVSRCTM